MTKQETSVPQEALETPKEHPPEQDQESEQLPIGKLLRQVREKKALTIHDISRETYISSSNLTSIELGNYNELPADTFIRGQIIIYANFLGLDGTDAARLFFEERAQCLTGKEKKQFNDQRNGLAAKKFAEPTHISSATWAISLLLLITIFLTIFSLYTDWNPFGYLFQQESAPVSSTSLTTLPNKPAPTPEAAISTNDKTSNEITDRSVIAPIPAAEPRPEKATNNTEQDTTH
ncbi:MAG: helix-turn-helix domain-containing protein [Candidatus Electrothrix sp. ATG1]|nr:helix-turn-helix domain-containing protein [Candidatus Electrothrix sp. ATG1]